ncbi:TRAP transporter substrate-binding protein [Castellaniella sp. WN]
MFKSFKTTRPKLTALLGTILAIGMLQVAPASDAANLKLRLGHVFAIDSPVDQASQAFARLLKERTHGEIEVAVFPNSQIGGDESLARDLARGSLDLAFVNPGSLSGLDPLLDFHYLPYIVTSFDEADKIFYNPKGILQTTLRETMAKHRMVTLGFFELEFRAVTNSRKPVEKPADLEGLKLRVPGSAGIRDFFIAAGSQAVAMPFPELFTALQQGTVDGQDNGASITYNSRLFEAQKYMTTTNHVYAMGAIAASRRLWDRLSEEQKRIFTQTAEEVAAKEIQANRALNADYLKKIAEGGVQVTTLSPEALAGFRAVADKVWSKLEPVYGKERVAALRKEVGALPR